MQDSPEMEKCVPSPEFQEERSPTNSIAVSASVNMSVNPTILRFFASWWQVLNTLLITVGATIAILICVSNTFSASAKAIWHDSADNWLAVWTFLRLNFTPFQLTLLTWVVDQVWFWMLCTVMLIVDFTQYPERVTQFKIQNGTNTPLEWNRFTKAVRLVLFNQFVVALPFTAFLHLLMTNAMIAPRLPTFNRMILEVLFFMLCEEILFYYGHRLLHSRYFYKRIHKIHHQWTSAVCVVAYYAHPIEHLCSNMIPVVAGPLILQSHLMVFWVWSLVAIFNGIFSHSGYHLPWMSSPEAHDYHHLTFNEIFGVFGVLDYLHGTDVRFRKSRQFQLHKTYYSDTYTQERIIKGRNSDNAL